ncbi:MAG: hypothetical protein ACD_19C00141G0002 [uncultured bacterium]|nr:MAG: hypothetical protein ACD_19C00141G0002 [uncultured bacterium]
MNILTTLPLLTLLLANLIPVVGIYFYGWTIQTVVVSYWLEAGIQGFFGTIKLFRTQGSVSGKQTFSSKMLTTLVKLPLIPLFLANYFIFLVIYGLLLYFLVGLDGVNLRLVFLTYSAFLVSYIASYYFNFIKDKEFKKISPFKQLAEPYRRFGPIHLCILLGVFASKVSGDFQSWVLILAFVKTVFDVGLHIQEHNDFSKT